MTGRRGPVSKPVELQLLEGGRGHRPVDVTGLFRPEAQVPGMPKGLDPGARKIWRALSVELDRYNLLSKVDQAAFAMLCRTMARVELLERSIAARMVRAGGICTGAFMLRPSG